MKKKNVRYHFQNIKFNIEKYIFVNIQPKSSNGSPRVQRRISKWTKVKKAFLTSASMSRYEDDSKSMPSSPTNKNCHFFSEMRKLYL